MLNLKVQCIKNTINNREAIVKIYMLIVLPLQPFIKCPECFCISNASIYFRSSWLLMFACKMLQVICGNLHLLWHAKCLYTVCFSMVIYRCSFTLDPIVRPVSPNVYGSTC